MQCVFCATGRLGIPPAPLGVGDRRLRFSRSETKHPVTSREPCFRCKASRSTITTTSFAQRESCRIPVAGKVSGRRHHHLDGRTGARDPSLRGGASPVSAHRFAHQRTRRASPALAARCGSRAHGKAPPARSANTPPLPRVARPSVGFCSEASTPIRKKPPTRAAVRRPPAPHQPDRRERSGDPMGSFAPMTTSGRRS